jgi:hypothetical protein
MEERRGGWNNTSGQGGLATDLFQKRAATDSCTRTGGHRACPLRAAALSMTAFSQHDRGRGTEAHTRWTQDRPLSKWGGGSNFGCSAWSGPFAIRQFACSFPFKIFPPIKRQGNKCDKFPQRNLSPFRDKFPVPGNPSDPVDVRRVDPSNLATYGRLRDFYHTWTRATQCLRGV